METIKIITNENTIDLNEFKKTDPVSYGFFSIKKVLLKSNFNLIFVNEDINYIYYRIIKNNKPSYIMHILKDDILKMKYKLVLEIIRDCLECY